MNLTGNRNCGSLQLYIANVYFGGDQTISRSKPHNDQTAPITSNGKLMKQAKTNTPENRTAKPATNRHRRAFLSHTTEINLPAIVCRKGRSHSSLVYRIILVCFSDRQRRANGFYLRLSVTDRTRLLGTRRYLFCGSQNKSISSDRTSRLNKQ